jgi:hypothetical protein
MRWRSQCLSSVNTQTSFKSEFCVNLCVNSQAENLTHFNSILKNKRGVGRRARLQGIPCIRGPDQADLHGLCLQGDAASLAAHTRDRASSHQEDSNRRVRHTRGLVVARFVICERPVRGVLREAARIRARAIPLRGELQDQQLHLLSVQPGRSQLHRAKLCQGKFETTRQFFFQRLMKNFDEKNSDFIRLWAKYFWPSWSRILTSASTRSKTLATSRRPR